jgi:hypothetical protein
MAQAYFIRGGDHVRYDLNADRTDDGYPQPMTAGWSGLGGTGFEDGVDAALDLGSGKVYLFKGGNYLRLDQTQNVVDGEVRSIAENWLGLAEAGFGESIDSAVNWGSGNAYFFKGGSYLRYDIAADTADPDGARSIAEDWPGLGDLGFADGLDATLNPGNGGAYFFKGDQYVRYDVAADRADDGYPLPVAGNWPGLEEAGFGGSLEAAWVKLAAATPAPSVGRTIGPGDHVWYFDGQTSTDKSIPQASWFPGFTSPTDYLGHGKEIYQFVVHADGTIFRGRPHMRGLEGSFAWLNNNPGNLTGVAGGPDYGQYPGKFNWHNFLIFPSRDAGHAAIATFLRGAGYRDLTIAQAFAKYAPASDGNDPVGYAGAVAAGAGVSTSTLVRDLSDEQMRLMQDKVADLEGARAGEVLTRDSPELPDAVRALLG